MNRYHFPTWADGFATFQNFGQGAAAADEVNVLRERVQIVTAGEKELVNVPGDGNCMVHAFCRSAQVGDTVAIARQNAAAWVRANPAAHVQGPDSQLNLLVDLAPFNGSWDAFCDSLVMPAQGAGDVAHYGDVGLLVGLSGHYGLSIGCITAATGEHWLLIFNATQHEYCATVYIAREGGLQEHYWATRQVGLTDMDQYLLEKVAANMPISLTLNSALNCADKECDLAVRTLSTLDEFEAMFKKLRSTRDATGGDEGPEDDQMHSQVDDLLQAIALCRRSVQVTPQEVAAAFAETGEGKSFLIDTLQFITAPTKEAYQKAARTKEKQTARDELVFNVLVPVKEILRHRQPSHKDLSVLLEKLQRAASTYFALHANPALQQHVPQYLNQAVLDDLDDLSLPPEEDFDDTARAAKLEELQDVVDRLQAAMVDPAEQAPPGVRVCPLSAGPEEAKTAWSDLHKKFSNLLWTKELGNDTTYLLRCERSQRSTTLTTLSIEYAETFMLVEKLVTRDELLTQLMEIAEYMHPCSELYNTPEAVEFRAKDAQMGGLRRRMYDLLTTLRLPATAEEARAAEGQGDNSSYPPFPLPQPRRAGGGAHMRNRANFERLVTRMAPAARGSPAMPSSAQAIPLTEATEAILCGPQTTIHSGSNECLMQERLAIFNLLHAGDQRNQARRFLVVESRLFSPSTINKKLTTLDVPGFGVTDPGERAQTRKALEQASTLLLPTFRDLHNEGALELLRLSRFVRQGRARVEAAATNVVPDTGRVEVQDNQAEEQTEAEEQQLVLMSYPENKGHKLASVKDLLNEIRAREFFSSPKEKAFRDASEEALSSLIESPSANYNQILAVAAHLSENFTCFQFLPSLAAAIACASHRDMERLRQSCPDGVNFSSRINELLCKSGLSATLALPEYLQARRLVPALYRLVDTLATSQPTDAAPPVLLQRTGAVERVLENVDKLYRSLYASHQKQGRRYLEQGERAWFEAKGNPMLQEARKEMRAKLEGERRTMQQLVNSGTAAVLAELRRQLGGKTIQRSFFGLRTSSTLVDDVDIADIVFGDLDILRSGGEVVQTFVRAPLKRLIENICRSYKAYMQEALNSAGLKDERCAAVLQRLNAACQQAERDLGAWVLDKGTLKNLLSKRGYRKGNGGQVVNNVHEARARAFANYRAGLRQEQLGRGPAAFLDIICDEEAVRECRREAIELLFSIFLEKIGTRLRQGDLLDTLVAELETRAVGLDKKKAKQASFMILYRKFRSAIRDIYRANRHDNEDDARRVKEEDEGVARRVMEVGAGIQGRLEAILADIDSLLTGTRTHPIPASAQQHLAGHVLSRMFESLVCRYRKRTMGMLQELYMPEVGGSWLKTFHSFHDASDRAATDARDSPFHDSHYSFMSPPPGTNGEGTEAMDVDQPHGTPAKGRSKQPKGSSSKRRSQGRNRAAADVVAVPPADETFFSAEHLERLKARLAEEELILVESAHLGPDGPAMISDGGIIFRHGLMHAAALLLYGFIPTLERPEGGFSEKTPSLVETLFQEARRWRRTGVRDSDVNAGVAAQLTCMVCASLISDTIFAETPEAQRHRVALQSLLSVDLLTYLEGLSRQHVGAHPSLLHFVSRLFKVNIQIWDGVQLERPPLLLGVQPLHSFTLNFIYFPPPRTTTGPPNLHRDSLSRYGRWAVAMRKPLREVRLNQKRRRTGKDKGGEGKGSGGSDSGEDWESGQSSGGEGGDTKRVRFGKDFGW